MKAIEIDRDVRGGAPVIKGTRFPLSMLLGELAECHPSRSLVELCADRDLDREMCAEALRELATLVHLTSAFRRVPKDEDKHD